MAVGPWTFYNHTTKEIGDPNASGIQLSDVSAGAFKVALFTTSSSFANDLTKTSYSSLAGEEGDGAGVNEVASGFGYTTAGEALTNVAWTTDTGDIAKWDADDFVWNASGGNIVNIKYAVIYQTSPDLLVCFCDLDTTADSVISNQETDGASSTGTGTFTSSAATFQTDGVIAGDILNVTSGATPNRRYRVTSVDSQTQLTVTPNFDSSDTGMTYTVDRRGKVDISSGNSMSILLSVNGIFRFDGSPA